MCNQKDCGNYLFKVPNNCRALNTIPEGICPFKGSIEDAIYADQVMFVDAKKRYPALSPGKFRSQSKYIVASDDDLIEAFNGNFIKRRDNDGI